MPNFNHKGPKGCGPKTGMKLGKCRKKKLDAQQSNTENTFVRGMCKKENNI